MRLPPPLVLLLVAAAPSQALDNGLARTPPLGLSTWAVFAQDINDTVVREMVDAMVANGLRDAVRLRALSVASCSRSPDSSARRQGYTYLMVDDGE